MFELSEIQKCATVFELSFFKEQRKNNKRKKNRRKA